MRDRPADGFRVVRLVQAVQDDRERNRAGQVLAQGGLLDSVTGQGEALATPGIEGLEITIGPGKPVVPLPEGDRYLGFMFARGTTAAQVEAALREGHARLQVNLR